MVYGSVLFLAWIIQNFKCDVKIIEFFVVMSVLWRKGANWFAPVAHSVCRSVDQVMSAQYFLTLCLKVAKRWWMPLASRWPQLFCGHVVKGQGLTAGLWENVRSMSFDTFCPKIAKLGTVDAPWAFSLLIFRSHGQRSRSNSQVLPN